MREFYDAQIYRRQRQQEAENQRRVVAARAENAAPNEAMLRVGDFLVYAGEQFRRRAQAPVQQNRHAYR
jgi:hypothetical protein